MRRQNIEHITEERERDFEIEIAANDENPHFLGAIKNETS